MKITLAYVEESGQVSLENLVIAENSTVADVLALSTLVQTYAEIDADNCKVGVYSAPVEKDTVLKDGDRVEIYHPLTAAQRQFAKERLKNAKK